MLRCAREGRMRMRQRQDTKRESELWNSSKHRSGVKRLPRSELRCSQTWWNRTYQLFGTESTSSVAAQVTSGPSLPSRDAGHQTRLLQYDKWSPNGRLRKISQALTFCPAVNARWADWPSSRTRIDATLPRRAAPSTTGC